MPDSTLVGQADAAISRASSSSWIRDPRGFDAQLAGLGRLVGAPEVGRSVILDASHRFLMSSRTNQFPVTVTNNLTEEIRVQVVVQTDNPQRLTVPPSDMVTVAPGQSVTVNIRPEAASNGLVIARAHVATADGHRVTRRHLHHRRDHRTRHGRLDHRRRLRPRAGGRHRLAHPAGAAPHGRRRGEGRMSEATSGGRRLISATAVMASGTMVSRILGLIRTALLAFVLGNGTLQVEAFNVANTVPTSLYLLLAGGTLNNVLVPQIVRAVTHDEDGGKAFVDRIITGFLIILGVLTVVVTVGDAADHERLHRTRVAHARAGRPLAVAAADELHLHAATVLLRGVLPARAGAERHGSGSAR